MINIQSLLSFLEGLLIFCALLGALYAFLRGRKDETVKIQQNVITALKEQLDAIEKKLDTLEQENTRLKLTIETIQAALKQKGIHVTIDGDMVVIEQKEQRTSVLRQRQRSQTSPVSPNKQEE